MKWLVLVVAIVALLLGSMFALGRVPLIEGDRIVRQGSAYGFAIGMTRQEAARVLRERYARRETNLRVVWDRGTPLDTRLSRYENTDLRAREHGEHRVPVATLVYPSEPFALCDTWTVEMPAEWVNDVYLQFRGDRLAEIQRSRWLFERP